MNRGDSPEFPHFLFAGDGDDLAFIQATLRRLPVNAYGQAIVEVAAADQVRALEAPERLGITWLCRDDAGPSASPLLPGERLEAAIRAWLAEWMCPEAERIPRVIWIGASTCPPVEELHRGIRQLHPELRELKGPAVPVRTRRSGERADDTQRRAG